MDQEVCQAQPYRDFENPGLCPLWRRISTRKPERRRPFLERVPGSERGVVRACLHERV